MNDISNPYELSIFIRCALAGMVIFFGLWVALKNIEKDHEKLLKKHEKNVKWLYEKKEKKKTPKGSFLSQPIDKVFVMISFYLQEVAITIQGRMLRLSYWEKVAVLVIVMAFYSFMLVYFKMDETSMRKEREIFYGQIKNAVQEKIVKEKNN